jgi:3-deoxy-7-phosphoheptulonate synthase
LFNRVEFDEQSRIPNPDYLLQGYTCAATTLNYIRALVNGGFASLHHPENWDLSFVSHASKADEYQRIIHQITQSIEFLETIDGLNRHQIDKIDFYTSHEALNLYYEQALTRNIKGEYYNLSTHLPWIGMRTTDLSGAHIAYAQGIQNPIGIKLGPHATSDWLIKLINNLNPDRIEGKLLLISRLGHEMVQNTLPDLIKAAQSTDIPVTWACDPMHGNTQLTSSGIKTRDFDLVLSELVQTHETHQQHQSYLGGVHFELTGENVTECIGGARGLSEDDLHIDYRSLVDPRLNYEQSLEMALKLGQVFKK